ncbi:MAG: hypothetical protein ACEY3D_04635 [Rickettsia sp.]
MSFLRKQESSKTIKNLFFIVYFINSINKIIFWIPAFAGMT